jgi:hypothetical protein
VGPHLLSSLRRSRSQTATGCRRELALLLWAHQRRLQHGRQRAVSRTRLIRRFSCLVMPRALSSTLLCGPSRLMRRQVGLRLCLEPCATVPCFQEDSNFFPSRPHLFLCRVGVIRIANWTAGNSSSLWPCLALRDGGTTNVVTVSENCNSPLAKFSFVQAPSQPAGLLQVCALFGFQCI